MYSWRARIGMIIPSTNAVAEPQVNMMSPDGVVFHTTRLAFAGTSAENVARFIAQSGEAAKLLADAGARTISAAFFAAEPPIIVPRDATVGPESGTRLVFVLRN